MTGVTLTLGRVASADWRVLVPMLAAGLGYLVLFFQPMVSLVGDWWRAPDAGHGLLLGPLAIVLAWRRGRVSSPRPQHVLGLTMLAGAVLLRYVSGLAAEPFTMRLSMMGALGALLVYGLGVRQLVHWWLSALLLLLSIPLPAVVLSSLALPLQLKASEFGATLLEARHVPVALAGNVIRLPGRSLFVTEACSGLRSLTALIALGVLIGGLWLRSPWSRLMLVLAAIPVAMLLNGLRIFLTGFLVFFVSPELGDGVMHYTEGWALFVAAFTILGGVAWVLHLAEGWRRTP
ncbi:MAG: exosortase [Gemmatimonadetes bacterium]|nr:exosortase [Gemmatimonadota bacterium]